MSVLKSKRHESSAMYVNVADEIFADTLWFLSRLSNRYQRMLGEGTMNIASQMLDNAEMAQNIYVKDQVTFDAREKHLIEARAGAAALDVHLAHIWRLLEKNPEGAFTDTKGKMKTSEEALKILDAMASCLGENIDTFRNLVTKLLASDKERFTKRK